MVALCCKTSGAHNRRGWRRVSHSPICQNLKILLLKYFDEHIKSENPTVDNFRRAYKDLAIETNSVRYFDNPS
jgi:hypothetical protein